MSLEQGVLGFLSIKPMSGYDIKKLFDMSASYFWPADQTQIYRTLKKLRQGGMIRFQGAETGETVARKVYAITKKGTETYLRVAAENDIHDFISRDKFLMQLFFSGALDRETQLEFLDAQLNHVRELSQHLIDNYNENLESFLKRTGLKEEDRRIHSAVCAHRWGMIKCREYAKLLEEIKAEITAKQDNCPPAKQQ